MVDTAPGNARQRAEFMVSKGWVQGVALVMIFGFFVMGFLAVRTYTDGMPQPTTVVTEEGEEVFSGAEITAVSRPSSAAACSSTARSWATAATSAPTTRRTTCVAPRPSRSSR